MGNKKDKFEQTVLFTIIINDQISVILVLRYCSIVYFILFFISIVDIQF